MKTSAHFIFLLTASIISSCSQKNRLPFQLFAHLVKNKNVIIVSCLRCSCVDEEIGSISKNNPLLLKKFDIYADTTCSFPVTFNIEVKYIAQNSLDSMSADVYNLIIINKEKQTVRLVTTSEMSCLEVLLPQ